MTDLIEITLPVAGRDPQAAAVIAAAAVFDLRVPSGAVVETTGVGDYGETENLRVVVRGYAPAPVDALLMAQLRAELAALPTARFYSEMQVRTLAEQDWAETWKQHYHPFAVGNRLFISPSWETPTIQPGQQVVWMDPGMAFGTGNHPTTQLMLRLIERHQRPGDTVLDVGTGSGILAIAALKLGAARARGVDIDPLAVEVAAANARRNKVARRFSLAVGSVPKRGRYTLICANILADVLADLLLNHQLAQRLAPNGFLLLSGIIAPRCHLVDLALAARGLVTIGVEREGEWVALVAQAG